MLSAIALSHLSLDALGTLSAAVMLLGYVLYGFYLLIGRTTANATAWGLMCVSATSFLVVEFLYGVPWNALKLGLVDAVVAFAVVAIAYSAGRMLYWTSHDKKLVSWYFILLALYFLADLFGRTATSQEQLIILIGASIIIIYNATMVIEFIPIIRETWHRNEDEVPWPWFVWTISYGLYFYVRLLEDVDLVNLVYPLFSVLLHGIIAVLTVPIIWKYLRKRFRPLPITH